MKLQKSTIRMPTSGPEGLVWVGVLESSTIVSLHVRRPSSLSGTAHLDLSSRIAARSGRPHFRRARAEYSTPVHGRLHCWYSVMTVEIVVHPSGHT